MIAGLGVIGFGALMIFLLDAGMNGMRYARGWVLAVALVCLMALWLMGAK